MSKSPTDFLFSNEGFISDCIFPWCMNWNTAQCPHLKDKYMQVSIINKATLFLVNDNTRWKLNNMCAECSEFNPKSKDE